jgi:hypothetical protein
LLSLAYFNKHVESLREKREGWINLGVRLKVAVTGVMLLIFFLIFRSRGIMKKITMEIQT